jgi:DNA-binding NarL/FixJ family response regulator
MITVLVADHHLIVRGIICRLLERAGDIQVIARASSGEEAVSQALRYQPNIASLAVAMPLLNGIHATRQICEQCPDTHVLIVSGYDTPEYVRGSLNAGALGYVLKDTASQDLVIAVRSLYEGKPYFSKKISRVAELLREELGY